MNAQVQEEVQLARAQLARFVVDRATQSAIDVITSCAMDGHENWKLFFQEGLADAISEDPELEAIFFSKLCAARGLPYSAQIMDAYLSMIPPYRLEKLFDNVALKKKAHPVNVCLYSGSFNTKEGEYFLDIFKVFIKRGLTPEKMCIVASRCSDELERACHVGNIAFMKTIFPNISKIPEELLQNIVSRPSNSEDVIYTMVNECGVDIEVFKDPKILVSAIPKISQFIFALDARINRAEPRVPENCQE